MDKPIRIALLIGRGSKVPAILECVNKIPNTSVVFVLSCKGEGVGTEAAINYKIPCGVLKRRDFAKSREGLDAFAKVVTGMLQIRKVDIVVMAGWMVVMPKVFTDVFRGRAVNIHPSILPAYRGKGEDVICAQWNDRAVPAGCTLHHVDEGVDTGNPIKQGYIVKMSKDYEKFASLKDFEEAMHAKEDEVLCSGIKKLVCEIIVAP